MSGDVRGRFAPSPSGRMHIGNAFSALLAWLSARSADGQFVLRLEDLDERTANPGVAAQVLDDLAWFGLDWDGEPLRQSEHLGRYEEALARLQRRAEVYECFCSRADLHAASAPHASDGGVLYAGTCRRLSEAQRAVLRQHRSPALRLHVPSATVGFSDAHCGRYEQDLAAACGDFVVRRSDGVFAYQLVCVADDAASGVSEVVRGDDLLSSTPRQIYLQQLLGLPTPAYAHHPLLVDTQGRRLSKRDGDCDLGFVRSQLAGPEPLVGFLAWCAGLIGAYEPLRAEELVAAFSWGQVVHGPISVYERAAELGR